MPNSTPTASPAVSAIPISQVLPNNDVQLQKWARTVFVDGPRIALKVHLSKEEQKA